MSVSTASEDLRLIPEFCGKPSESVTDWIDRLELVCDLKGVKNVETVIPLRLGEGALAVYQQLTAAEKTDPAKVKKALRKAFGKDPYLAYDEFVSRRLRPDEPVDVYLAELKKLSSFFGGVPEETLRCAFVAGLPDSVRQTLRAGSRIETMNIEGIVARARALLSEERGVACAVRSQEHEFAGAAFQRPIRCLECNMPNHIAKNCLLRGRGNSRSNARGRRRCFRCGDPGHLVSTCPENDEGGRASNAPHSSPCE